MILKIDTTQTPKIRVELIDPKSNKKLSSEKIQTQGTQILLPIIISLVKKNKKQMKDITAVEVNTGPGSFTGTRVGVAVANTIGFALGIPVNGKKDKITLPIYEKSKYDL